MQPAAKLAQGLRTMIHAQSAESMIRAARAHCTAVEHGVLATQEAFTILAQNGIWFDPNIGLNFPNYFEFKPRFLGLGKMTVRTWLSVVWTGAIVSVMLIVSVV